ncbi:MAG TPA: NUDIX hydrolase [Dongiaceae bacterium]|jgi:8-oxo-dGTP pyrophosphatase MutT (NUDIX family)
MAHPASGSPVWPVSIKGVCLVGGKVVLLKNERDEWELPGGRLEAGEDPVSCLQRELDEELGIAAKIDALLDCWRYPVLPTREVLIVTFGVLPMAERELRLSDEHKELGLFAPAEIGGLTMPDGYRRSIRDWVARAGKLGLG